MVGSFHAFPPRKGTDAATSCQERRFLRAMIERRTRTPQGRPQTSFVPLFPGYVFLFGNVHQRSAALTTNCVVRDIPVCSNLFLSIEHGMSIAPESRAERETRQKCSKTR